VFFRKKKAIPKDNKNTKGYRKSEKAETHRRANKEAISANKEDDNRNDPYSKTAEQF